MSHSKKSRKPGTGSIGAVKNDRKKVEALAPKKPKKKTGNQAGNRQQSKPTNSSDKQSNLVKDARIGSKKPVALGQVSKTPAPKTKKSKPSPIAGIRVVEIDDALATELHAIEEDALLLQILAKQEDDIELSDDEVDYFNEKMDRHQQISALLGLDNDEDDISVSKSKKSVSEDDLWDKLDSAKLSDYE